MDVRIVTRGDLDGLTCSTLIGLHEPVDEILLTHAQVLADGGIEIGAEDIIANLPYRPGCALWFDHHLHTATAPRTVAVDFEGAFGQAPSAARLVYEYYGGEGTMPQFAELVRETDRLDSAELNLDDILDPQRYIQLGYTLDSRSGLGDIDAYFLTLRDLLIVGTPIESILAHPEVEARCRRLETEDVELHAALKANSRVEGNVVVTDFRDLERVPVGNRFLVFALFPQANVAVRMQSDARRGAEMLSLGHSVINRTCRTNVGELAARFGGGGHRGAASMQMGGEPAGPIEAIIGELRETTGALALPEL